MTTAGLLADLRRRGLLQDSTDPDALEDRLSSGPIGVYVGFDPTADSLHVGHLLGQVTLRRFQLAGHRPVALAGGATGMVGDPSGRSEERNLLDAETLGRNVESIATQLRRILDFSAGPHQARLVNNADWTSTMGALDFLRDVGKHITVNQMMAKDSVRSRLDSEHGLSFTEFSYMLLQANDFRHLCSVEGVEMQMGGSDQWGNITVGIDLIRKTMGRSAFGATWPLITRSDGQKFGKTAGGAVWLDARRTSVFQFRQFWMQQTDEDIVRHLARYSLRPWDEVTALSDDHLREPSARRAHKALADEMTTLVHGEGPSREAAAASEILFGADPMQASEAALGVLSQEIPFTQVSRGDLGDVFGLLVTCGLSASTSEARRTVGQRGLKVNGHTVEEGTRLGDITPLQGRWLLLRRGKSTYHLLEVRG